MKNIYIFNINNLLDFNKALSLVSDNCLDKINKYKNIDDKKRTLIGELLLRYATSINDLKYTFNDYGKPYLIDDKLYFNISHCKDYVICVIDDKEIGIDIEKIKDTDFKVSNRYFLDIENKFINNDKERFFKMWTLKEAFIKNIGKGLNIPLNSFMIDIENGITISQNINKNTYYLNSYKYGEYMIGVCSLNDDKYQIIELEINDIIK